MSYSVPGTNRKSYTTKAQCVPMRRFRRFLVPILCIVVSSGAALGQSGPLSGAYTIDASQPAGGTNFQTFSAACGALTDRGVSANVTFTIASGTYTEAAPLKIDPPVDKPDAGKTVTFVLAGGALVFLNVPADPAGFAITVGNSTPNSVDYVTFNGSNSGSDDRSWTINATGPDSSHGILVFGDHVQIKNILLSLAYPWSFAPAQGIVLHQTGASDSCLVENCDVSANYGIVVGTSTGTTQTGNVVRKNTINCLARGINTLQSSDITIQDNNVMGHPTIYPPMTTYGIYVSNTTTTSGVVTIERNGIHDLGTNSGTTPAVTISGIAAGSKGATYHIERNKVYNLFNATSHATTNVQAQGITLSNGNNGSQFFVINNFVYGMEDNDTDASGNWTAGIRPITAGKVYVLFNTVYVKHTTRNHYTAAFICGGGVNASDTNFVYNNIFYTNQTGVSSSYKSYCIYKGGSFLGTLVSDYNLLYNDGGGAYSAIGSPSGATFPLWQASGRDPHSSSVEVVFVSSSSDLHLGNVSNGDPSLTGTPMFGITHDIDDETRGAYPYMGADEGTIPLSGSTSVQSQSVTVPHVFALNQNFPNPFNPSTMISFTVESSGYATLRVYTLLGQQVATLFDGVAIAGKMYQRAFVGENLPTGLYLARLESDGRVAMQKMLLMK